MTTFRESLRAISPPWLRQPLALVADAFMFCSGVMLDGLSEWIYAGIKARFPDLAPPDALGHIGNDRDIERGPAQTDTGYATQLRRAFDTWRRAGNAGTVLSQLAAYFTGIASPPMRAVSDSAVWHEYDYSANASAKTVVGTNWNWDAFHGTRWWRGWVIIDSTAGPWQIDEWAADEFWGDGGTWGTTATSDEVESILQIVAKWKPKNVHNVYVIVVFDTILRRTDSSPPNPNGTSDTPLWRFPLAAAFWPGITD